MSFIYKKKTTIITFLSMIILFSLLIFVIHTSEILTLNASEREEEKVIYDIENIMSFYAESISAEGTLINDHYIQQTSEDTEVTCLSCHDIDLLRELYLVCDLTSIDEVKTNMIASSMAICLTCHGSYKDLAALTKDKKDTYLIDSEGMVINPHDTMQKELECGTCHSMHINSDTFNTALNFCYSCHITKSFIDLSIS